MALPLFKRVLSHSLHNSKSTTLYHCITHGTDVLSTCALASRECMLRSCRRRRVDDHDRGVAQSPLSSCSCFLLKQSSSRLFIAIRGTQNAGACTQSSSNFDLWRTCKQKAVASSARCVVCFASFVRSFVTPSASFRFVCLCVRRCSPASQRQLPPSIPTHPHKSFTGYAIHRSWSRLFISIHGSMTKTEF